MFDLPIYINVFNRVRALGLLVDWLERAGHQRIILCDNNSTYPPLLEYLDQSPHTVNRFKENRGARWMWYDREVPDEYFVFTDPDCVPIEKCPLDAVSYLYFLLQRYPMMPKAGLGLYLNDVPQYMPSIGHERSLMNPNDKFEPQVFRSAVDTTFAVCRPAAFGQNFQWLAIRTGFPHMCRHDCPSWYVERPLDEEDRYYLEHASKDMNGSSWANRMRAPS